VSRSPQTAPRLRGRPPRRRFGCGGEAGFTLIELLVAAAMGVVLMAGVGAMVIAAMRSQPEVSKRAQNISAARWMLERFTREIRNGVAVEGSPTASELSFRTYVRHTSCGGSGTLPPSDPAILCKVTYTCNNTSCWRAEVEPGKSGGLPKKMLSGIDDRNVFSYSPNATEATYIRVTLHIPNPSGPADITISDGASMRNAGALLTN
jgi:prepilin-type N-terminal cleavage/methylation domain-containing protein